MRDFAAGIAASSSGRGGTLKTSFSVLAIVLLAFSLVACASRPESGFLSAVALSPPGAVDHTLLIATTRERDDRPGTLFNGDRASAIDYAELTVSIPPNHKQNEIEWATTPPGDPNVNFVVRDERYLDGDKAFLQALNAQLALRPPGSRNVFLFVHGFNTMFAEAVYRGAQLAHDSKAPGVPVLFTWASRGQATAYVYDLNSATAARDALEHTLRLLLRSNAEKVNVLAHSMGNWVTVEAFRQIRLSGDLPPVSKIGTIVLAAPDIDIDVFKAQLRRFGKPQKPFYVVLSQDDRALFLSRTIAGGVTRVGDSSDTAELAALGARVIDLTDVRGSDATNHDKFVQLASVAPELRGILARGINANHRATDAGERAVSGVGSVVALPLTLLGAPVRIIANQ
ncbi:MAG TPA: alpha/beta hydrolase [Roseiarcus sp.]|jgi:esterase/lipase superfamily enzyme